MSKRPLIEIRLYNNPGDWASIEFQVLIYMALTSQRSRVRIRRGGPEGEQIAKPLTYQIGSNDVLEYMPRNQDLAELLVRLMEADKLRILRRRLQQEDADTATIKQRIDERQVQLDQKIERNRTRIERSLSRPIQEIVEELNRILEE